jgi:hypothetical protein
MLYINQIYSKWPLLPAAVPISHRLISPALLLVPYFYYPHYLNILRCVETTFKVNIRREIQIDLLSVGNVNYKLFQVIVSVIFVNIAKKFGKVLCKYKI